MEKDSPNLWQIFERDVVGYSAIKLAKTIRIKVEDPYRIIPILSDYLQNGGVPLLPFNHPSTFDPIAVIRFLEKNVTGWKKIMVPGSSKFFDGRMGYIPKLIVEYLNARTQIQIVPTAQHNDDNSNASMGILTIARGARKKKHIAIPYAPEGTRSVVMQQAQKGFGWLVETAQDNTMIFPLGISGSERIHTKGSGWRVNPFAEAHIMVCPPFTPEELIQKSLETETPIEDLVMHRIAENVPPQYRGYYAPENIM